MDRMGGGSMKLVSLILAASVGLTGCAAIERSRARDTEQLLAAAGFTMRPADTAEQQQHLAAIAPYRLVSDTSNGSVEDTYADPRSCKCVYVRGSQDYSEYQRLTTGRQIEIGRAACR